MVIVLGHVRESYGSCSGGFGSDGPWSEGGDIHQRSHVVHGSGGGLGGSRNWMARSGVQMVHGCCGLGSEV